MKILKTKVENFDILDLLKNEKATIHFIGIGGISMSAIAEILLKDGHSVSGSDGFESEFTKKLRTLGAKINIGHNDSNVQNQDIVCYTAAVSRDNPELVKAKEQNIPVIERCVFLGELIKLYKNVISISGTHGKTTVTSMITSVFMAARLSPTALIGGKFPQIKSNCLISENNDYLILEACEYVDSFLNFVSQIAVITNIEEDHLDYYKDLKHIISSFIKFSELSSEVLVINNDDKNCQMVLMNYNKTLVTFGINNESSMFFADEIEFKDSFTNFKVYQNKGKKKEEYMKINIKLLGIHNVYNALAAIATSFAAKIEPQYIKKGIEEFCGVERRFQKVGVINGITIVDDYAHHPTEIRATLESAMIMNYKKIWCVFQSHTYTRTAMLFNEFVESLTIADAVIVTDTYAARERNTTGITARDLARAIPNCIYMENFDEIVEFLINNVKSEELVITMGAGTITEVSTLFYERLKFYYS